MSAERTGRDDDESGTGPEVTVPPWLRTGSVPGPAGRPGGDPGRADRGPGGPGPGERGVGEQGPGRDGAGEPVPGQQGPGRAGSGSARDPRTVSPNRITLGAPPGRRPVDGRAPALTSTRSAPPASPVGAEAGAGTVAGPAAGVGPDALSTLVLGPSGPPGAADSPARPASPARSRTDAAAGGSPGPRRPVRIVLATAAGAAVLGGSAVLGFVIARGAAAPVADDAAGCAEVTEPDRVVGSGPGSLHSPVGAVLAFDHAYYVERSAEKAFEAVSPLSRMSVTQLREDGVDRLPEGTTHCVEARRLSPTLLGVRLTQTPPDAEPVVIHQRVRVEQNPDGTWGIVAITPAG